MVKSRQWDPEAKRNQLIEAAIKVLNRKTYSKAPVDEIAKCAGVAKGTVYLYFKSKEEIYFAVLFALIDKLIGIVDDVKGTKATATRQMGILLKKTTEFIAEHRQIFNAVRNETTSCRDKLHNELHKKIFEMNKAISEIVVKGIDSGEFKDYPPQLISGVFFSAASLIVHQQIEQDKTFPQIPQDMLFQIMLKGFAK